MDATTPPAPADAADPDPGAPAPRRRRGGLTAAAVLVLLFLLPAGWLIARDYDAERPAYDQSQFHLPTVRTFAAQWPRFDFADYLSATSPGYHLALAAVDRFAGGAADVRTLRFAGALFTVGLLATLAVAVGRRVGFTRALALCLPLPCTLYVFASGAWVLPDNAAWWGVLAVLLVALRPRVDARTYLLGAALLAVLVFVRQIHLWMAAVLWLAAWLGSSQDPPTSGREHDRTLPTGPAASAAGGSTDGGAAPRPARLLLMALCTLPAFLLVGWLVWLWGGPVPPAFRAGGTAGAPGASVHQGGNPAAPAMAFAVLGLFGFFYLGFLLPPALSRLKRGGPARSVLAAGVLVGLILGVLPETTYDQAAGRWSGWWNVVRQLPTVADRSPLVVALAALGGGVLAVLWLALDRRDRLIVLAAWVLFVIAQTANAMAWPRYYEGFALMLLALAGSRAPGGNNVPGPIPRWAAAGPVVLSVLLAGISYVSLRAPE